MYRDIPEELRTLIEPIVQAHGLELVTADLVRGRGPWELRVTVDTPVGDGHVSIDACAALSREIGTSLDAVDAIPNRYKLEVGSPGLDRRLGREKDFANACGSEVAIETRRPLDGRRRFRDGSSASTAPRRRSRSTAGTTPCPSTRSARPTRCTSSRGPTSPSASGQRAGTHGRRQPSTQEETR